MKKKLIVLLSLVLTAALTIPVFAATEPATIATADTHGQYTVEVNGEDTDVEVPVMVPLRKMAKATGMTITKKGKKIRLDTGKAHIDFALGKDAYVLATSIPDAVGMTDTFSLGCAPYVVNKTTYVPLSLFWILQGNDPDTISMSGQKIQIKTEEQTQIPNPFVNYDTIEEAQKAVGFSMQLPTQVSGYNKDVISVMDGKMLQITYRKRDAEICIRKAAGKDDISGVYENYAKNEKATIGSAQAELRGDGTKVYVAVWTSGSYTYAVYASAGMTNAEMTALVQQVK